MTQFLKRLTGERKRFTDQKTLQRYYKKIEIRKKSHQNLHIRNIFCTFARFLMIWKRNVRHTRR